MFAVLTDLHFFYFFSYDGSTFRMDKEIHVSAATRTDFFNGMGDGEPLSQWFLCLITVSERLFSILLEGYATILEAVVKRSCHQGINGDVSTSFVYPSKIQIIR